MRIFTPTWPGIILCLTAFQTMAAPPAPTPLHLDEITASLERLDKIAYHPNLLPIILQHSDYLELTPEQITLFTEWRKDNFRPMYSRMKAIVKGRADFIEASLDPDITETQLHARQQRLFVLQQEVLAYKLSCRTNIISTFSDEQWDSLQILINDLQTQNGS